jgi:hypothetical protein
MPIVQKSLGFQQLDASALAASVGFTIPTINGQKANAALISSFTGNVRYRDDGTAPTSTVGMRLVAGNDPFLFMGDMEKFRAILEGGSPTLNITYVVISPG